MLGLLYERNLHFISVPKHQHELTLNSHTHTYTHTNFNHFSCMHTSLHREADAAAPGTSAAPLGLHGEVVWLGRR